MRNRTIVALFALAMLVPLLARAHHEGAAQAGQAAKQVRWDRGRVGATRQGIADELNRMGFVPPNGTLRYTKGMIRVSTAVDKSHQHGGPGGHTHIVGHVPRLVEWSVPSIGISGNANSNTIVGGDGKATTVSNVKPNPPPWSLPSQP